MSAEHVPSILCSQVGHVMASAHVVRCRHTEALWWRVTAYVQHADDTAVLLEESGEIGPFDTPDAATHSVLLALNAALTRVGLFEAE